MKTTAKALFLSLFSLLLITGALVVFLLAARGRLLDDVATQSSAVSTLEQDVAAGDATITALAANRAAIAATATVGANELRNELNRAQGEVESLTSNLAETEDSLAASSQALIEAEATLAGAALLAPQVAISGPVDGAFFLPDEEISFTVFAADEDGLATVRVIANDVTVESIALDGEQQATVPVIVAASAEGPLVVQIVAADTIGNEQTRTAFSVVVRDYVAENQVLLATMAANVAAVREAAVTEPLPVDFVSGAALAARQRALLENRLESSAARVDPVVWRAFDFVGPDYVFDLAAVSAQQPATSLLALYDPPAGNVLLYEPASLLTAAMQRAFVGAYARALLDTFVDLDPGRRTTLSRDAVLARTLVIEGDIALIQLEYRGRGFFQEEPTGAAAESSASAESGAALQQAPGDGIGGPQLLLGPLPFPYDAGEAFVAAALAEAGWAGVDALYTAPPASSEQVLHPEAYLNGDEPISLTLPAPALGAGWELRETESLGEYLLRLYLAQVLFETDAVDAAAGWGGDRYAVYFNEETADVALLWELVWDTPEDLDEFSAAFTRFAADRTPGATLSESESGRCWIAESDVLCLATIDETTRIVRAPDIELANTLRDATIDEQ